MSGLLVFLSTMTTGPSSRVPVPDFSQISVFATFERRGAFELGKTRVRIGTVEGPMDSTKGEVNYWFVRERHDRQGKVLDRSSASTAACPASLKPLRALEALQLPHPDVPGYQRDYDVIVVDGVGYKLEGTSRHADGQPGDYSIESNRGTPLARWADGLLRALENCWKPIT